MGIIYMISSKSVDGFVEMPIVSTPVKDNATVTNIENIANNPGTLPGALPIAPYEQLATMSPLPYQDTALIKANAKQLSALYEDLKAFLTFEAQHLSEKSDPTIQLPLTTTRSDYQEIKNEMDVIKRNPGIQPTITLSHLNDMTSNLEFLKKTLRLEKNAGSMEGFVNHDVSALTSQSTQVATLTDLKDFVARIQGEILRLSASGTTDPVVTARVSSLTKMKGDVQQIIDQLNSGALLSVEVPILKSDIDKALPILSKPNEPLPQLIKTLQLPAGLGNMLPSNLQKDPDTMREISKLIDKYANTFLNGMSASFNVKYTSPREVIQSKIDSTGFPSLSDLNNVSNAKFTPYSDGNPVSDRYAQIPGDAGRGPSHFDWKQRAREIESQIRLRKLNPSDFGVMPPDAKPSSAFSWKGYTQMICTRLQTTMDPALPETCGCPPMDWKGWRVNT